MENSGGEPLDHRLNLALSSGKERRDQHMEVFDFLQIGAHHVPSQRE